MQSLDNLCANAIRVVSADAIQRANSGHPGMVMGAAPMGYALYSKHMIIDPKHPDWQNRDRFVLSAGHGSMLLYSLLHMFGFGLTMEDLKSFRQWNSPTAGHPEYGHAAGIEATTGPLGQGVCMAVGMAMAEAHLAAKFNKEGFPVVDHYTYALVGDGCLQEGISSEACSFAGTQKLDKLIVLYDRNRITIEGNTSVTFNEDVAARYRAYGWHTIDNVNGDDIDAIADAIGQAKQAGKPTLILVDTKIARSTPLEGSEKSHGSPLGAENVAALRKAVEWPLEEPFAIPQEVYDHCAQAMEKGAQAYEKWVSMMEAYKAQYPDCYKADEEAFAKGMPAGVDIEKLMQVDDKPLASRAASGNVLNQLKDMVPNLFGGSADLGPSNNSVLKGEAWFSPECREGRNIHFGIREFAMAAMCNGMALHGGVRPFCATFFVFSDYMRNAIRLSALMQTNVMYVLTHDSISVGEDGPTHEPIEQLASFRAMPGCTTFRPADARETAASYLYALGNPGPTLFALSRTNLPLLEGTGLEVAKGGYVLQDCQGTPDVILMGSGSELQLCVEAAKVLSDEGKKVRVVSMPSMELFLRQGPAYRDAVLPPAVKARVAVEAGSSFGWREVIGDAGEAVCIDHFGASAPGGVLFEKFGFTVENVVAKAKASMAK